MKKIIILMIFAFTLSACDFNNYEVVIQKGIDTVEVGSVWVDQGAYVQIGLEKIPMTTLDVVDTGVVGFYDITYTLTYEEVSYEATRRVAVVNMTQIQASLNPGVDTVMVGDVWVNAGVTVMEGANVSISGDVDTNTPGTYTVIYMITFEDLELELERIITVVE